MPSRHRTERGSAGTHSSSGVIIPVDPALPRSVLCFATGPYWPSIHYSTTTDYSRGLDGFPPLMNGRSFETRPNVSA